MEGGKIATMTEPTRYAAAPVVLPLRLDVEPVPVGGCDVCAALAKHRAEARKRGDGSAASDCNIEIRQHPEHQR